ncbi:MAG TPA: zinc ribbon domain-containing protein [Dehalococcoidia bacterium]|nr:zinc ribbon domain-containing protein [Dehalococcoidia bacterium]
MNSDQRPDLIIAEWMEYVDGGDLLRLLGSSCEDCETRIFPRADTCPQCSGRHVVDISLGPDAELYSFTAMPIRGEGDATVVGQARFEGGSVVRGYIDADAGAMPSIGDSVEVVPLLLPAAGDFEAATTFAFRLKEEAGA